jgi:dissimilatory sulfite reductase related protein
MLSAQNNNTANVTLSQILDEEGFLIDPSDWTKSFTERKAEEAGIQLAQPHWNLIDIIRDKYLRLGALPPMRSVCKAAGLDRQLLKQQFGSCLNLWKLAGLPNPGEEAKAYMN